MKEADKNTDKKIHISDAIGGAELLITGMNKDILRGK
jgi:hypothetical protein